MVETLFWDDDSNAILQIPISSAEMDVRVWNYTKHGHYVVKSGYYLAQRIQKQTELSRVGQSSSTVDDNWDWIWKIKMPNKIKIFLWRVLKSSLPTLDALNRRGLNTNDMCPVCKQHSESILHFLRDCSFARLYWAVS